MLRQTQKVSPLSSPVLLPLLRLVYSPRPPLSQFQAVAPSLPRSPQKEKQRGAVRCATLLSRYTSSSSKSLLSFLFPPPAVVSVGGGSELEAAFCHTFPRLRLRRRIGRSQGKKRYGTGCRRRRKINALCAVALRNSPARCGIRLAFRQCICSGGGKARSVFPQSRDEFARAFKEEERRRGGGLKPLVQLLRGALRFIDGRLSTRNSPNFALRQQGIII